MKEIIIVLTCMPLYAVNALCDKYASNRCGTQHSYLYNGLKFAIGMLLMLPIFLLDSAPRFELGALLCGTLSGLLFAVSKTALLIGYQRTSVTFMTFCHAAGMVIPCLVGCIFWSESLSPFSIVGILLTIVSAVLLKSGERNQKSGSPAGIIIGIVVFLSSGGIMVMQKLMGIPFAGQSITAYNFYSFAVAFLLLIPNIRPKEESFTSLKAALFPAIGSAVSLCIIGLVMTNLTDAVPSVILFPLFNGLGIILVCISSVFLFKETFTRQKLFGLLMGVIGLCLVNF